MVINPPDQEGETDTCHQVTTVCIVQFMAYKIKFVLLCLVICANIKCCVWGIIERDKFFF